MGVTCRQKTLAILRMISCFLLLPFYILRSIFMSIFCTWRKDIKGNIIMVTGAGNGLGREVSLRLARLGAKIICVDMKQDDLAETVKMIHLQEKDTDYAKGYVCDISNKQSVFELRDSVIRDFGHVDILFNNAGIVYNSDFAESTEENIRRVVDVNILGTIWMTQAFLEDMKAKNKGQIVFTISASALFPVRHLVVYGMTKAAVAGLVLGIQDELDENPEWSKNIILSSSYPSIIRSNAIMEDALQGYWPDPLPLDVAAEGLIDGALKNCKEFAIPGLQFICTIMKIFRCFPYKFNSSLRRSAICPNFGQIGETAYKDYMYGLSQKSFVDAIRGKNKIQTQSY